MLADLLPRLKIGELGVATPGLRPPLKGGIMAEADRSASKVAGGTSSAANRSIRRSLMFNRLSRRQKVLWTAFAVLLAIPAIAIARGQCGGAVTSVTGYYNNLVQMGVVNQAAKVHQSAGYAPRDGSLKQWLKQRAVVVKIHRSVTITNYGCGRGLFGAGSKHLTRGWPVVAALPSRYSKDDIKTKPRSGYVAKVISMKFIAQASCSNPGKAVVTAKIFVKKNLAPSPRPKSPSVCCVPTPPVCCVAPPPPPPSNSCTGPNSCNDNSNCTYGSCNTTIIIIVCSFGFNCNSVPEEQGKPALAVITPQHIRADNRVNDGFFEAFPADGASPVLVTAEKVGGPSDASVTSAVNFVDTRYNHDQCDPRPYNCGKFTIRTGTQTGILRIKVTARASGQETVIYADVEVLPANNPG